MVEFFADERKLIDPLESDPNPNFDDYGVDPAESIGKTVSGHLTADQYRYGVVELKRILSQHGGKIMQEFYFGDLMFGTLDVEISATGLSYLLEGVVPFAGALRFLPYRTGE